MASSSHSGTTAFSHVCRSWSFVIPLSLKSSCALWCFFSSGMPNHSTPIGNIQSTAC